MASIEGGGIVIDDNPFLVQTTVAPLPQQEIRKRKKIPYVGAAISKLQKFVFGSSNAHTDDALNEYKNEKRRHTYMRYAQILFICIVGFGCTFFLFRLDQFMSFHFPTNTRGNSRYFNDESTTTNNNNNNQQQVNNTFDIWEDWDTIKPQSKLAIPPYFNISHFLTLTNGQTCNTFTSLVTSSRASTSSGEDELLKHKEDDEYLQKYYQLNTNLLSNIYYRSNFTARTNVYISLLSLLRKMVHDSSDIPTNRQEHFMCSFMFGKWPSIYQPIPCVCLMRKLQGSNEPSSYMMFNPAIVYKSVEKIKAKTNDLFWSINNAIIVKELPKALEMRYDIVNLSPLQQQQQQQHNLKSLDRKTNIERTYAPLVKTHNKLILLHPFDINVFDTMDHLYYIHLNRTLK